MKQFNNLTPAEDERLGILVEECGEVLQAIGKIYRHGYVSGHPNGNTSNRQDLEKECGHVRHAMIQLCDAGDLQKSAIHTHAKDRIKSIIPYLHHQNMNTPTDAISRPSRYLHKIPEEQHFADGSLVTEEAKKGKFVVDDDRSIFNVEAIISLTHDDGSGYPTFSNEVVRTGTCWEYLLPLKEPEYIAFDKDTFPFEPVWVSRVGDTSRLAITVCANEGVILGTRREITTWDDLMRDFELVNPDGTRSVCGVRA